MRKPGAFPMFLLAAGCGGAGAVVHELPPDPGGGVERVPPEQMPAALDTAYLDCDGDRWLVVAEVAGRAHGARATLVGSGEAPVDWSLTMSSQPMQPGALWQRFEASVEDPALPCDRNEVAVVIEALDADGATFDCTGFGPGAAALVSGRRPLVEDGRPPGDWSACRIRG